MRESLASIPRPTLRLVGLLAAFSAPLLFAPVFYPLIWFVFALDLAVFLAFIADSMRIPSADAFHVKRSCAEILSLSRPNKVELEIENHSSLSRLVVVRDTIPHTMEPDLPELRLEVAGRSAVSAVYHVVPRERGNYQFGEIHFMVFGRLGLASRIVRKQCPTEVRVYPDISGLNRLGFAWRTGYLREVGRRLSQFREEGTSFSGLRDYVKGDDYRIIDWKVTARRGKLISREYETEQSQQVLLCLDAGRLMTTEVGQFSKFDYAVNAAWALASVAVLRGDLVGLLVFADSVVYHLPPRRGKPQLLKIIDALYRAQPRFLEPDYARALAPLNLKRQRRSLIVFFTEILDLASSRQLQSQIVTLAPRHLPLCVLFRNLELESTVRKLPQRWPEAYEKAAAYELQTERRRVLAYLQNRGAMVAEAPASELAAVTIDRYLEIKSRGIL